MSKEQDKVIESQKELLKEYEKENAELKQKYEELDDFEKSQCAKLLIENAELKAEIERLHKGVEEILNNEESTIGDLRRAVGLEWIETKERERLEKEIEELKAELEKFSVMGKA